MMQAIVLPLIYGCLLSFPPADGAAVDICDDKTRGKKCGSFSKCEDCVRCSSECAWCVIGGLCSRFCHHLQPCTDETCAKDASDFKCMQMQDAHYALTDFQNAGGVDLEAKAKKVKPGIAEERKDRNYDPFAFVVEDRPDKNIGIEKKFTGALDSSDPPSMGEAMLSNNGAGQLLRR